MTLIEWGVTIWETLFLIGLGMMALARRSR
jgi:hypothetical protein